MEPHFHAALAPRSVSVAHRVCPDLARGAVFGNLLEKVTMCVEEETQPGREIVDMEAALKRPIHVFDAVPQSEREFLNGRRTSLADVVAADRNRVKPWRVARSEFNGVGDQPHGLPGREDVFLL